MKRAFFSLMFGWGLLASFGQDLIVRTNADTIEAKVRAIDGGRITYSKWSNLNGPTYTIDKKEVASIRYENGEEEVFTKPKVKPVKEEKTAKEAKPAKERKSDVLADVLSEGKKGYHFNKVRFQAYLPAIGFVFNEKYFGPTFDFSVGARCYDFAYIGFEVGWQNLLVERFRLTKYGHYESHGYYLNEFIEDGVTTIEEYDWDPLVTIGINLRGYIPTNTKIFPFLNLSIGGYVGMEDYDEEHLYGGMNLQVGAGADFNRFSLNMGYSYLSNVPYIEPQAFRTFRSQHQFYIKFGVRIGRSPQLLK